MITGETGYTLSVRLSVPFHEADRKVRAALQDEGFGILTEADIQAAFREKLGLTFRPYKILGACNPSLAHRALTSGMPPRLTTTVSFPRRLRASSTATARTRATCSAL